ncbi:MAG: hypothetical protein DRQ55_19365 [Planctomycetota bacterium]|nr:MAG: hypothetical protein DRQ55_19365 [Planctomycetota bacterium]
MFTYDQAKAFVIQHLAEDADHHDLLDFPRIGEHFDEFDYNLPRGAGAQFEKLHVALTFWDSWQDARNHDWQYYPKIKREDWPRLAQSIVADVSADRDIQNQLILELFGKKK